ncbi:MAG: glycosyltransferase [Sedimentisphaerales bacterium]|nr:glycosyltransferase [Sedimentisphaerales bacterium]
MHIAHVVRSLEPHMGGPPRSIKGLGDMIQSAGHDISYWSTGNNPEEQDYHHFNSPVYVFQREWPQSWFRSTLLIHALQDYTKNIDIFHLHGLWSHPTFASVCMANRQKLPVVIAPRGELNLRYIQDNLLKRLKKRMYLLSIGKYIFTRAACLHALSEREIEGFYKAGYRGPVTIVPNGINAAAYENMPDPMRTDEMYPFLKQRRVVLYLARISPEKGLDILLHAWARLVACSSYRDAFLILAGPDDRGYMATVQALAGQWKIENSIAFMGSVYGRQKAALLSRSEVFVLPSYSEGFSVSVLEAMASAKPVLITPRCNFPEVVENKAGLCCEPNVDALEEALRRLLDMNLLQRSAMGLRGRQLVKTRYTWDAMAGRMLTVYECILQGKEIPLYPPPSRQVLCLNQNPILPKPGILEPAERF